MIEYEDRHHCCDYSASIYRFRLFPRDLAVICWWDSGCEVGLAGSRLWMLSPFYRGITDPGAKYDYDTWK